MKMKNLCIIMNLMLAMAFIGSQTSCNNKSGGFFNSPVTISDLRTNQSQFVDSLVILQNVRIESCESVLNYSKSLISDGSGQTILLFSNKPFKKGEVTNLSGRMLVVYQKDDESCLVFVDNRLKPFNDILDVVKVSLGM